MTKRLVSGIGGTVIGLIVGFILFNIISGFFGETWTVEAGVPWIVIYSPIFVSAFVGFLAGLIGSIFRSIVFSIVSGILYLLAGIAILLIGGILSTGWSGITLVFISLALLMGGGTVVIIIISD